MLYTHVLRFVVANEKALMDLILTREPDPPRQIKPDISVELEKIILKCLNKDPKKRFADAEVLRETILDTFPQFGKNR
jgi:hypothetical protein